MKLTGKEAPTRGLLVKVIFVLRKDQLQKAKQHDLGKPNRKSRQPLFGISF